MAASRSRRRTRKKKGGKRRRTRKKRKSRKSRKKRRRRTRKGGWSPGEEERYNELRQKFDDLWESHRDVYMLALEQMSVAGVLEDQDWERYTVSAVAFNDADIIIPVILTWGIQMLNFAANPQNYPAGSLTDEMKQKHEAAIYGLMTQDNIDLKELTKKRKKWKVGREKEIQVKKGNKEGKEYPKKKNKQKGGMPILSTFSRGAIAALALFQDPAGNYIHPKGDKTVPQYSLNSTHTGIKGNMKALSQQQLAMAKKYSNELAKYDKEQMSYSQAQWFHTMTGDQAAAINVAAEASRQPKPEKPKFAVEVGDVDPQIAKKYGWRT